MDTTTQKMRSGNQLLGDANTRIAEMTEVGASPLLPVPATSVEKGGVASGHAPVASIDPAGCTGYIVSAGWCGVPAGLRG